MTERNVLGMLVFISSEAVFFAALIVTFVVHRHGPGSEARALLNVPLTALFSVALFASSATMVLAERRSARGDARGVRRWLLATAALGLAFLVGQAVEYRDLILHGVDLDFGVFGSSFFILTGFHGLHVIGGLVAILALAAVTTVPAFGPRGGAAVDTVAAYWHFVDAVWVVIFALVYLWTLVQ
ncbi:MAG TPA: cytochrome c oxidase subunit 3 [Chloroflexota bacterium]